MRTVDPIFWSKKNRKPPLRLSRPLKFGIKRSEFEIRLRRSLSDAAKEWLRHSSVKGVQFVVDVRNPLLIRWCYLALLVSSLAGGAALLALKCWSLRQEPALVVNELLLQHTLRRVNFPAVGICSYNVISRAALDKYTKYLFSLDKNRTYTLATIRQNLRAFGAVLTKTVAPFDPSFMQFLADVAKEANVTDIIFKMSPKCKSMLVRCMWNTRVVPCESLFAARVTSLGFCCIFNSRYYREDTKNAPYKPNSVGVEAGLTVVVREDAGEAEYARRPSNGVEVILFEGAEYPLLAAGGVRSYPAMRNSTLLMRLRTHVHYAAPELKYYSDASRGCRWAVGAGAEGSWSRCVARCHRRAAEALCGCVPHTLPADAGAARCSPAHLACLAKHREKFLYFYPDESLAVDAGLSEEVANGLACAAAAGCRPACGRQRHAADCVQLPHGAAAELAGLTNKGLSLVNTSTIRLFYTSAHQPLFLTETNGRWYETVATLGSQWVFLVAVTVLSVAEVLYHCLIRWAHHYRRWERARDRLPRLQAT